jgi:hypothetical protein
MELFAGLVHMGNAARRLGLRVSLSRYLEYGLPQRLIVV